MPVESVDVDTTSKWWYCITNMITILFGMQIMLNYILFCYFIPFPGYYRLLFGHIFCSRGMHVTLSLSDQKMCFEIFPCSPWCYLSFRIWLGSRRGLVHAGENYEVTCFSLELGILALFSARETHRIKWSLGVSTSGKNFFLSPIGNLHELKRRNFQGCVAFSDSLCRFGCEPVFLALFPRDVFPIFLSEN